jgi:glycosyltransferase involved in cell wall biosynthesis
VGLASPVLRVATFSYGLPVPGAKRGGIERVAHMLADGLARRGHEVVIFTHDPKPVEAAYEVRLLPWRSFVSTWLGRRMTMGYLGNVLAVLPDYHEFDVIVAHGDSLLLPLAGKPIVRLLHGSALGEARSAHSVGRRVLQVGVYAQELVTALLQPGVVAVSESARQLNPLARRVIPHGVDDRVFTPEPEERSPEPSLLFVGTLAGRKRGRLLLETFVDRVRRSHPTATLTIVGDAGAAFPGVTYRLGVEDLELATLYRQAWVYVTPSTYEGFGLPLLEAMACGTPVVATRNPGSVELLDDGRYGVIAGDDEFAARIVALLSDAQARETFRASGLRRTREFSLKVMLDRYEALLFEFVGGHVSSVASY